MLIWQLSFLIGRVLMAFKSYLMIIPAAQAPSARGLAAQLGWTNEFSIACSADGNDPATHYLCHGQVMATKAENDASEKAETSVQELQAVCTQYNLPVTFTETTGQDPIAVLSGLGLTIIQPEIETP
jgi:hypothetical protein